MLVQPIRSDEVAYWTAKWSQVLGTSKDPAQQHQEKLCQQRSLRQSNLVQRRLPSIDVHASDQSLSVTSSPKNSADETQSKSGDVKLAKINQIPLVLSEVQGTTISSVSTMARSSRHTSKDSSVVRGAADRSRSSCRSSELSIKRQKGIITHFHDS
ncbi:unnamed protein product [Protopolystoma xenopodis]|uniref:Uncharacterized protein n=1 Tax=Protopolystoma xenopodis TaxID=117903 RepID=A0A3S5B2Q1_9PLAT|nr:unnamed protein product [Protopolystoma xenopodis]